jgi:hypothetical protein
MKKEILLFSMTLLVASASFAQIDKKDILLGATFSYGNSNSPGNISTSNSNLHPKIGYAIGNNSVLNLTLGYNHVKSEDANGNTTSKNSSFTTGLTWQKFFPIKDKVGWYTDLYGTMSSGKYTQDNGGGNINKTRTTGYGVGISPGLYYFPISSLLLSVNAGGMSYGYSKYKSGSQPDGKSSNFTVNLLNYFGFGIGFIINKKTE